eukprot:gene30295-39516_t
MQNAFQPQIILLREGTDTSQGKAQIISNINACQAVAETLRTTLGPRGMDKLVFNGQKTTISNDGATIMKLLDIVHPAAKTLVDISMAQDAEVGDGTTSVVLLAAEILKECKEFIEDADRAAEASLRAHGGGRGHIPGPGSEKENAEVRITDPDQYQSIVDAEWKIIYDKLDLCVNVGAKVILSRDLATQYFADRGIFSAGRVATDDLDRVAKATGAAIQTSVYGLGGGEQFLEETDRSVHDALMIVKRALTGRSVVAGGGAIEMELSSVLRKYSRFGGDHGKQQLIVNSFARALEIIPRQLAENAGIDSTDVLNRGRALDGSRRYERRHLRYLQVSIDETVRNPQSEKPGAPSQGVGLGQGGGRGAANTRSMVSEAMGGGGMAGMMGRGKRMGINSFKGKGYDIHGCLHTSDKYYAKIQYSVSNNRVEDFTPPSGFICYTPATINFFPQLNIQAGKEISGNAVMVDLVDKFATCVVDDDPMDTDKCIIPHTNSAGKDDQGYEHQMITFKAGSGSNGSSKKTVTVKVPISFDQYSALNNNNNSSSSSGSNVLTFTLSVNSKVSPGDGGTTTPSTYLPHPNPAAIQASPGGGLRCPVGSKIM